MPTFLETPLDGVGYISQGFHVNHGALDIVGPFRSKIYLAGDCVAAYRLPQPSPGQVNYTFGNMLHIIHADGLHEGIAHLDEFTYHWPEGVPLPAGTHLGYQGYTGLTDPVGPAGSHIHWSLCTIWPFPPANAGTIGLFRNPGDYLISEAERMALFQQMEKVVYMLGGQHTVDIWYNNNAPLVSAVGGISCLGSQPGLLGQPCARPEAMGMDNLTALVNSLQQTYGTNDLLNAWRQSLAQQNIIVP